MKPFWTILPPLRILNSPNQSARSTQDVRLVVVHDPEGPYAAICRYLMMPSAKVSYHVLLSEDGKEATQFVPWHNKSWSVARFNSLSDNISIAGYRGNAWSYPALNKLARAVAFRLKKRKLPANFVAAPIGFPPPRGFTFHSELGTMGGGHSDPGLTGLKKSFFINAVKFHYRIGGFRRIWGVE